MNTYEETKYLSEEYLFKLGNRLNFVILRPSIIFDFNMRSKIIDNFIKLNYFNIGLEIPKSSILNFVLSSDVSNTLLKLSQQKSAVGKAFNLSSNASLRNFVIDIEKIIGERIIYRIPFKILLILIKLKNFVTGKRNGNSLKAFFSNISKVSCEKIQNSINIEITEDCTEFLKFYIEQKR